MTGARSKLLTGAALVGLALVSFALSYVHLGRGSLAIAFGIAAAKATLVGAAFMEIGREKASFKLALLAAALLVGTLLAFVASDVRLRGRPPLPPPRLLRATVTILRPPAPEPARILRSTNGSDRATHLGSGCTSSPSSPSAFSSACATRPTPITSSPSRRS